MNSLAPSLPHAIPADTCFHCGEALSPASQLTVRLKGKDKRVCCVGCGAVSKAIFDAGLDAYYDMREPNRKPMLNRTSYEALGASLDTASLDLASGRERYEAAVDRGHTKLSFYLDGITCAACLWLAESTLKRLPGVTNVEVNYTTHQADVIARAGELQPSAAVDSIARVGLRATPVSGANALDAIVRAEREALKRLGVAFVCMMQIMMLAVPRYFVDIDESSAHALKLMDWASLILTIPVIVFSAEDIFRKAWSALRGGHLGMDVPVALAIIATFASSAAALVSGRGEVYFDSIAMFVCLLGAARYAELRARNRARKMILRLANALPPTAQRMAAYPHARETVLVSSAALLPGDHVLVGEGMIVPVDGDIVEGESSVDESLLTGEARPVAKVAGMCVSGGTQNVSSPFVMRVTQAHHASAIAVTERLARAALSLRPSATAWSDAVARAIAPVTLTLALVAGVAWLMVDPSQAFNVVVAVLAVTCPCAIALAAPTAYAAATARLIERGLLIADADWMSTLPGITDVVFDKTGTLTTGKMALISVEVAPGFSRAEALRIARALEIGASHPVAEALRHAKQAGGETRVATRLRHHAGAGVEGDVRGASYRFGRAAFACAHADEAGRDEAFVLSRNGAWQATFRFDDPLRAEAKQVVDGFNRLGLGVHILSGDSYLRARDVADRLGVPAANVMAEKSTAGKTEYLQSLMSDPLRPRRVLMVGDGVNDGPVLAVANASIAIAGNRADLPKLSAGAVLVAPRLTAIGDALTVSKTVMRVVRENFAWAVAYNLIAVPLAMLNWITPAWAAVGMAVSSLVVVANSMRLSWARRSASEE